MPKDITVAQAVGGNTTVSVPNAAPEGNQLPATLGPKAAAASLSVTMASDQEPLDILTTAFNTLLTAIRDRLPAAGAASETTIAAVNAKLPALQSGRVPTSANVQVVPAVPTHSSVSLTTTAGVALAANANRTSLWLQNTGTTNIILRFDGQNPSSTVFFRLTPNMVLGADFFGMFRGAITAAAESGTATLQFVEGV